MLPIHFENTRSDGTRVRSYTNIRLENKGDFPLGIFFAVLSGVFHSVNHSDFTRDTS